MIGIILLTVGALNAALAMTVETCTMGAADSLYGGWLTFILYLLGAGFLRASPPAPWMFVLLIPAACIALWQSWFAITFAYGFWAENMSACAALDGNFSAAFAAENMDGGEPLLTALWAALSLIFWFGVGSAFGRAWQERTKTV